MPPVPSRRTPGEGLRALLDLARDQDEVSAAQALLDRAVAVLVPDEALVLERLCTLGRVPLVHIWTRPLTGAAGEPVLENASRIGRLAGTALPEVTPAYVAHLLALGLVCTEPAEGPDGVDPALDDHFHALLADPLVLRALARANGDGTTPRVLRRALTLTPLGARLVQDALASQVESSTDEP